jgi:hypothetical protein
MKKKYQILVTYVYISPDFSVGETPTTQINTAVFTSVDRKKAINKALDFVEEHFDGLETFRETYRPEVHEHFSEKNFNKYILDDYSAGQWATFVEVKNGTAEFEM